MYGCYKLESSLPRKLHTEIKRKRERVRSNWQSQTLPVNHEMGGCNSLNMLPEQVIEDGMKD